MPAASVFNIAPETLEIVRFVVLAFTAVIAVVEAYGNCDAVVEVAVKNGAVTPRYTITVPRKSELPATSKIFPVVVVALVPTSTTCETVAGYTARSLVVVAHALAPPEP